MTTTGRGPDGFIEREGDASRIQPVFSALVAEYVDRKKLKKGRDYQLDGDALTSRRRSSSGSPATECTGPVPTSA
ncbi:hypothetical protein NKG05_16140 [Oerskovia sp. M15]